MKRTLLVLGISVLLLVAVGAQEANPDWFWNKPIESVQWEGLKKANRNDLDGVLRGYIGKPFTEDLWLEIQSKLYELDYFDSIEPQAIASDSGTDGLIIRFVVKEKPSILSLKVDGNNSVRTSDVLGAASCKAGEFYNPAKLDSDDAAIVKYYQDKGYPDAKVTHEVKPSADDPDLLEVVFHVSEGEKVSIRSIKFVGNNAIPSNILKGKMTLKENGLFQDSAYSDAKLEESKTAILDLYATKGYVDAQIVNVVKDYEKDAKTGKNWLTLTISVSEGKQWTFGGVNFTGNQIFTTEKLQSLISLKPGAVLNYKKFQQDKAKIEDLYFESGYIYNQITFTPVRDEASAKISYSVNIVEMGRAHIENLTIKGNTKTKDYVIKREIPLEEGDVFSKTKVMDGLRNLYNLQYFSTVEPEFYQGSTQDLMDLVINVEEMSTAEVNFGVTLSSLGKQNTFPLSGFVKWNDRNLGGTGQNLQTNVTLSQTEQSVGVALSDSWLWDKRISRSLGLNVGHSLQETGQDIVAPIYTEEDIPDPFTGLGSDLNEWTGSLSAIPDEYLMPYDNIDITLTGSLGYTHKLGRGDLGTSAGLSTGFGRSFYDADKYRPYEEELRVTNNQWLWTNKLLGRVYFNSTDYWYNPSSGTFLSERLTVTGLLPVERQHYIKSDTRADAYLKLFTIPFSESYKLDGILALHSGFQALLKSPWSSELQVTRDWISLDGTFNVRGWTELYGSKGTMLWENSVELRLPVIPNVVAVDMFFDAGAMLGQKGMIKMTGDEPTVDTTKTNFSLDWDNFAFSTGVGARFIIAQFPFRLYLVKRFTFDGATVDWKTQGLNFDFVLSITQPLY